MLKYNYSRAAAILLALAVLIISSGAASQRTEATQQPLSIIASEDLLPSPLVTSVSDQEVLDATPLSPDPLTSTSTFYQVRADLRRCASPMCGGHFVKRVNLPLTRCADGRYQAECYVAEIDWSGQPQVDAGLALLRGTISTKRYDGGRLFGQLRVLESWQAANNDRPEGTFYRVRDRGLRCIAYPCPTHHEAKLNSTESQNIAGVNTSSAGANNKSVGSSAMTGPEGLIVAGNNVPVRGPGGSSQELKATQVYVRAQAEAAMKPCKKSGCSNQVCTDHSVITTCEWRPEYACYQKATCERQADGNCGFTKTRALTSCLAAK